jgi:ATP-dependent Lon protease
MFSGATKKERRRMEESQTRSLPMMPIRESVVFPGMMVPFVVGRRGSVRALEEALAGDKKIFLAAQHDAAVDEPTPDEIFRVGAIVNIVQSLKLPDGNIKVLVEGLERAEAIAVSDEDGFFRATVRTSSVPVEAGPEVSALAGRVGKLFAEHAGGQRGREGIGAAIFRSDEPGILADTVAANLLLTIEEKQELLEIFDPLERLTRLAERLGQEHAGVPIFTPDPFTRIAEKFSNRHADVPVSTAVLTRWAEGCLTIDHLGALLRQEIEGPNRSQRARDLAQRTRRLARHLADELVAYGAHVDAGKTGPKR